MAVCAAARNVPSMMAQERSPMYQPARPMNAGDARLTAAGKGGRGAAVGVDVGQPLGAVIRQLHEVRVGILEERDVVVGVHFENRLAPIIRGPGSLQTRALQRRDTRGGATRILERIDDAPVYHVLLGAMGQLRFAEEKLHWGLYQQSGASGMIAVDLPILT